MEAKQLALDLPHRPALGHEDFLVAPSNIEAMTWIDRWPDWPDRMLAVHGPAGCGKTHLAHVWQATAQAIFIRAPDISACLERTVLEPGSAVIVEDWRAADGEEGLLHFINWIRENRGYLLLTGRDAPARWPVELPDLASRLRAIPATAIEAPDDLLLGAVLVKLFTDRQLEVGAEVITYLLSRMERSFAAASKTVADIDAAALAGKRPATIPLIRGVLGNRAEERS